MQPQALLASVTLALLAYCFSVDGRPESPPTRIAARAANTLDAAQSSSASLALSIYNNIGTTAFAAATAGVCRTGYQSYTTTSGTVRCCVGSIVDGICFTDDNDIVYNADPSQVLDGTEDAPDDDPSSTAASNAISKATSTIDYATATTFTPTATGGSTGIDGASTSTSYSQLSLTLSPTASSTSTSKSSGAQRLIMSYSSAGVVILLGSLAIFVAGGFTAML